MLNQSEESAGSSTAPRPELNPLLNPLLAENMKRWAEVYFSAAPQDRDQAVRALLEELREKRSTALPAEDAGSRVPELHVATSMSANADTIRCTQCGQENPRSYQFCGNCGNELKKAAAAHDSSTEWQRWEDPEYSEDGAAEPPDSTAPAYASPGYHGLSILQGGSETDSDAPDFTYEAAPRHRYRVYLGLFLAIVIGGLGYKAWKATQGSEKTYAPPPPPVSAADSNAPANAPESASATEKTESDATAKSAPSTKTDATAPAPKKAEDAETAQAQVERASKTEDETPPQPTTSHGKESAAGRPIASTANGSEELSVAQQYLSGRNSSQAAPWLWKSVSKHNGQATLLLADLYLKGDGVSKNCDQARILLDSAARKGVAGAGERLRHLAAFGCQ